MKPRLLDLFCGAGGAAMGYHRAGFEVVGVDHLPQPRYPFEFVQADALEYCAAHGAEYDVVHASPPCQRYTCLRSVFDSSKYPDLVAVTRAALIATGRPYMIENVVGAPLETTIMLCGAMFGLRTYRHRLFESNILLFQPSHPRHIIRTNRKKDRRKEHWDKGGFVSVVGDIGSYVGPQAMGIDWMTGRQLSQAIPPGLHGVHRQATHAGNRRHAMTDLDILGDDRIQRVLDRDGCTRIEPRPGTIIAPFPRDMEVKDLETHDD